MEGSTPPPAPTTTANSPVNRLRTLGLGIVAGATGIYAIATAGVYAVLALAGSASKHPSVANGLQAVGGRVSRAFSVVKNTVGKVWSAGKEFVKKLGGRHASQVTRVTHDLTKKGVKHIRKHLGEFQSLDPSYTRDDLVNLGQRISQQWNLIERTKDNVRTYQQLIDFSGKLLKVRTIVNRAGNLRSVQLRLPIAVRKHLMKH